MSYNASYFGHIRILIKQEINGIGIKHNCEIFIYIDT